MAREPMVLIATGMKGVGKTVETMRQIYAYVAGNPSKGVPPRKALIFDVNNEFSDFWYFGEQRSVRKIAIKDIVRFAASRIAQVRRIAPFWDDGRRMSVKDMQDVLGLILDNYRDGLLLVEDINKYTSDTLKADLVGSLATVRHIGIDLIAHYQSVGRAANPKLLGNTKIIRMHKTSDTVARHKNKFEERAGVMQIAESIIEKKFEEGNERYFLYVDITTGKIKGDFSEEDIDHAIGDYISKNDSELLRPLLKRIDLKTGKKMYDTMSAINFLLANLKKKHFS